MVHGVDLAFLVDDELREPAGGKVLEDRLARFELRGLPVKQQSLAPNLALGQVEADKCSQQQEPSSPVR